MTTRDFVFQGEVFTCRIVKDNEGCDLIIGGLKFLDAHLVKPVSARL